MRKNISPKACTSEPYLSYYVPVVRMLFPGDEMAAHLSCLFITLGHFYRRKAHGKPGEHPGQRRFRAGTRPDGATYGRERPAENSPWTPASGTAAPRRCGSSTRAGKTGALPSSGRLPVKPGQIYELSGWVRLQGRGDTTLCVTLRDADDQVTDWSSPGKTTRRYGRLAAVAVRGSSCRRAPRPCSRD